MKLVFVMMDKKNFFFKEKDFVTITEDMFNRLVLNISAEPTDIIDNLIFKLEKQI